jgi:hypothetical protein
MGVSARSLQPAIVGAFGFSGAASFPAIGKGADFDVAFTDNRRPFPRNWWHLERKHRDPQRTSPPQAALPKASPPSFGPPCLEAPFPHNRGNAARRPGAITAITASSPRVASSRHNQKVHKRFLLRFTPLVLSCTQEAARRGKCHDGRGGRAQAQETSEPRSHPSHLPDSNRQRRRN